MDPGLHYDSLPGCVSRLVPTPEHIPLCIYVPVYVPVPKLGREPLNFALEGLSSVDSTIMQHHRCSLGPLLQPSEFPFRSGGP